MLNRLLESTSNGNQTNKLRKLLMGVGSLVSAFFVSGMIFSIFSTNLAMGPGDIELTSLLSPTVIPESAPPPPQKQTTSQNTQSNAAPKPARRAENIQRPEESPVSVPKIVSTVKNEYKARPKNAWVLDPGGIDREGVGGPDARPSNAGNEGPGGFTQDTGEDTGVKTVTPVKDPVTAPPEIKSKPITVTLGVINGKAKNLAMPVVSSTAKLTGTKGQVRVNVLISETGRVISANAASGPTLLRNSAVSAALKSSFSPTLLSNVPVKVRGVILYNFK